MNNFLSEMMESVGYSLSDTPSLKLFKKGYEFFIFEHFEKEYLNKIMAIEEDEYYFRKYVIFYTENGLSKIKPNTQFLLDYIQSEDSENKSLFDKFEENMFFDDAYFIAMQLIIKLPFISLPHSDNRFEVVEDRIKNRIERESLIDKEEQVHKILDLLDEKKIREELDNIAILDELNQILGD